ncbi:MAG: dTDP-4-amino-4,6-dideoxygalactose transaminase [Candidatus Competibacteraceae bacterium]|nr:dTDP-4-amino-4,6-dideoxygalactose transaminase [Candidatus Competibacteraceae bacterium]
MQYRIPFNKVVCLGRERDYLEEALNGGQLASDGKYSAQAQVLLEAALDAPRVLLTTSCSDALEMCALLLDLQPGDEVIVPSFAFVTVAGAFALRGARIVFADIRPDTLNINEEKLAELITPRTRALVVVHYAGVACEMEAIQALAAHHRIAVIEDLAHGPFATYRGRPLGSFGALACLSFHETKNFSCGEGGALIVNDPTLRRRAGIVHQKGTDRNRFLAGEVDKYTWRDLGGSFAPADLLAAFLVGQLEARQTIQARRARIWQRYDQGLRDWATAEGVSRPTVPTHCEPAWHAYYLVMPNRAARDGLIAFLKAQGILAVFHYAPLHLSAMGRRHGGQPGACPVTERIASCLVRLPFFTVLSASDQDEVIRAVTAYAIAP